MAVIPLVAELRDLCLTRYSRSYAPAIQGWVQSDRELLWLAPATPPPLTVEKIDGWSRADQHRFLLWNAPLARPIGYAELDFLSATRDQMWIGHLILDPQVRGCGLSVTFTAALLEQAFERFEAHRVLLLVFPENTAAVRSYVRAGFVSDGYERRQFTPDEAEFALLRMALDRSRYRRLAAVNAVPPPSLPFVAGASSGSMAMK
jgi:ribosomal-protein-alanine N-acetyltransferase